MKTTNFLLLAGGAIAVYYFTQLNTAGATVNFVLNGVQILSPTRIGIQLLVQNVSNADITVYAMTGNVSINGNNVGAVSGFQQTDIGPTSQQVVNLVIDLSLLSLPSTIIALINQPGNSYNFLVAGNANINHLVVPFTVSQQVTI